MITMARQTPFSSILYRLSAYSPHTINAERAKSTFTIYVYFKFLSDLNFSYEDI